MKTILDAFNELGNHEKQNIYLRGCISARNQESVRRRPRNEIPGAFRKSCDFRIVLPQRTVGICKAAFLGLHGITAGRLRKKVMTTSSSIEDMRGKHGKNPKIPDEIRQRVRDHIKSFPARESHYSRSKNVKRKYLDSNLSVAKMHRMFKEKNPDVASNVAYWLFDHVCNFEFSISFGYPRSDICDTCEKLTAQIASAKRDHHEKTASQFQVEHELHVRRGEVFYAQIDEQSQAAKARESRSHIIAMDFKKNLPLPVTDIGQEYYKRQLWLYNFCIHDCVNNDATMYLYAEHYAGKGPNEVLSCLNDYVSKLPSSVEILHIFADNCFSQNKNKYTVAFLHSLVNSSQLTEVHLYFPMPGHSRMPCDRDFGRIEKKKMKEDRVLVPSTWVSLIRNAQKKPFTICFLEHPLTDNMAEDETSIIHCMDYKAALQSLIKGPKMISKMRGISFCRGKEPSGRLTMTGASSEVMTFLRPGITSAQLRNALGKAKRAFSDFLLIKEKKHADIHELLKYVSIDASVTFNENLKAGNHLDEAEERE